MDKHIYIVKPFHQEKEAIFRIYYECPISNTLKKNKLWEPALHEIFDKYITQDTVVVESGSYIGEHTLKLTKMCRHIHAFEPVHSNILRENIIMNELSNITLYRNGLSDRTRTQPSSGMFSREEQIQMIPLDSLELENVDFLFLNQSGNESAIVEGARKTIETHMPLILMKSSDQDICPFLSTLGYRCESVENTHCLCLPPIEHGYVLM